MIRITPYCNPCTNGWHHVACSAWQATEEELVVRKTSSVVCLTHQLWQPFTDFFRHFDRVLVQNGNLLQWASLQISNTQSLVF